MRVLYVLAINLFVLSGFSQPDTVHVVFKTHLDVGFTDFASNVVEKYMNEYIPEAIETARFLQKDNQKYIWTTGSWIITEYLKKASPEKQAELESAIHDGLICWSAYPFTAHNELLDTSLFRYSLSISKELDKRFGKHTIAANHTDVPGETIGVLGILQSEGVKMLHIGVNPASTRPETPPVFLWKDGQGNEVIVVYNDDYGGTVRIPGFNHILHLEFTGDNVGSFTPKEVKAFYKEINDKFPGAVVKASTLNEYANNLWNIRDRLPVISTEIGNTWIHCAGSDPKKYSGMRAIMRLRSEWLNKKTLNPENPQFREFSSNLLLLAEHTGGLDETSTLDHDHYSVNELAEVSETIPYRRMKKSWDDCRAYLDKAVKALADTSLEREARLKIEELSPKRPDLNGYQPFRMDETLQTAHFIVVFDTVTGAVSSLYDLKWKQFLTDREAPIGLFWHESFSEEEFQKWGNQYLKLREPWVSGDFGKPAAGQHGAVSAKQLPEVVQSFIQRDQQGITVLMRLKLEETFQSRYGFPSEIWLKAEFPEELKEIRYSIEWFGKQATRLPDAYWFSMGFSGLQPERWTIEKISGWVSPSNVISKGGRSLHGFNRGLFYNDKNMKVFIESPDCPIVAPGKPALLDFNDELPDLAKGWHFNLLNNKWGTNFPTWYSDDTKFRVTIHFTSM